MATNQLSDNLAPRRPDSILRTNFRKNCSEFRPFRFCRVLASLHGYSSSTSPLLPVWFRNFRSLLQTQEYDWPEGRFRSVRYRTRRRYRPSFFSSSMTILFSGPAFSASARAFPGPGSSERCHRWRGLPRKFRSSQKCSRCRDRDSDRWLDVGVGVVWDVLDSDREQPGENFSWN